MARKPYQRGREITKYRMEAPMSVLKKAARIVFFPFFQIRDARKELAEIRHILDRLVALEAARRNQPASVVSWETPYGSKFLREWVAHAPSPNARKDYFACYGTQPGT
jgi:hypothetical protein